MEVRQISYFLAVAEHLHFRRAAAEMGVTQPALSLQIQSLEKEIGVPLLKRDRQATTLTHAGEIFRREISGMLERAEQAKERVRRTVVGSSAHLRIGFISTAATARFLPAVISRFRDAYPHIELTLQNLKNIDQIEKIENSTLDIGFVRLPIASYHEIEVIHVHREPHVLLLSGDDPLARQNTIRPMDLQYHPLLMYSRNNAPGYHDYIMRALNDNGLNPIIAQEVGEMYTLVALVSAGIGAAIAPISVQNYNLPGVVVRQTSWLPPADIAIGFHKNNVDPACRLFIDMARRVHDMGSSEILPPAKRSPR